MPWKRREVATNIEEKEREMYTYIHTYIYNIHFVFKYIYVNKYVYIYVYTSIHPDYRILWDLSHFFMIQESWPPTRTRTHFFSTSWSHIAVKI